ncbi:hypothetical protein LRR18_17125, partial [Mangrovimonas sp. AS39]|uniref:hypothetical protein n=1 Tax=Mangrovimonas futianensis TaxID=2895523 RepID=UPI001E4892FC
MYDYLYQPDRAVGGPMGEMQVSQAALALHAKFHKEANLTAFRDDFIDGPLDVTLADFGVVEEEETMDTVAAVAAIVEEEKKEEQTYTADEFMRLQRLMIKP